MNVTFSTYRVSGGRIFRRHSKCVTQHNRISFVVCVFCILFVLPRQSVYDVVLSEDSIR